MARTGSTPAKIKPDIIPGRLTRPTVFAESIVGDIPVRIASRTISIEASSRPAPTLTPTVQAHLAVGHETDY